MFRNKKILAIIPARGGSKGIPKKNIVLLAGKPLIAWTIEAALKSKYIDKVAVSSDDDEILKVAKKWGAFPLKRPAELATDVALPEPVVFHALDHLEKKEGYLPDILAYLQPTSPLRNHNDIDGALDGFFKSKATAAISVYELDKKYLKAFVADKSRFLKGIINNKFPFMNRKQLPNVYLPNGAIYVITRKEFIKWGRLLSDKTIPYVISIEKSFDLDTMDDLKELRRYMRRNKI